MNKINKLYQDWADSEYKGEDLKGILLMEVWNRVVGRYQKADGKSNAEFFATDTIIKLLRKLPGCPKDQQLTPYNATEGDFAAFAATVAHGMRNDFMDASEPHIAFVDQETLSNLVAAK
jgi:hypothetical protein